MIHQESDVIIRAIRDNLRQDTGEIVIDEPNAFNRAKEYINQVRPSFTENVKLYTDNLPIFSRFQIERQIEAAYQREVRLPSGGAIVIDHTEALISIDINSARATKGASIEETALLTNLEAADEIAKQLRIRDIGGLIVIDFIDMTPAKNQREVENRLRNALASDRARIQVGRISRFGLLEMSRQRLRSSLNISTQSPCPRCDGRGSIRGVESVALSLIHLIQENACRSSNMQIQVQLPVNIATYLINEKREIIREVEKQTDTKVVIIPNRHLKSPHYHLKTIKDENSKSIPSYKLVKIPKPESVAHKAVTPPSISEPAVSQYLSDEPQLAAPKKPAQNGLIKRLWDVMFGSDTAPKKPANTRSNKKPQHNNRKPQSQGGQRNQPHQHKKPRKPSEQQQAPGKKPSSNKGNTDRNKQQKPRPPRNKNQSQHGQNKPNRANEKQVQDKSKEVKEAQNSVESNQNKQQYKPAENHKNESKQSVKTAPQKPAEKPTVVNDQKPAQKDPQTTAAAAEPKPASTPTPKVAPTQKESDAPKAAADKPKAADTANSKPVTEPVLTAPTQSAAAYQSSYKGLSSDKPLQQVTTKKED